MPAHDRPAVILRTWLARHAQTLVGSLGRVLRDPLAALLTMAVIAVALALPLLLQVFLENTLAVTANWNQALDISVYLDKKAAGTRLQAIAKELRARADVAEVRVMTADEALTAFKSASGFGSALDVLRDNPLPDTLVVTPTVAAGNPRGMGVLKRVLTATADVQTVQIDTEWVDRLNALLHIGRRLVWLTGALLGLGVMLVVGNTIRLDILNRRAEVEVMKLVGASDGFARRAFLYSGVWYGLGGGLLALALVLGAVAMLALPVQHLASLYGGSFYLRGPGLGWGTAVVGLSTALSWIGSWLSASRHIRSIEPA